MYNIVCDILQDFVKILPMCVFLRIIFDIFRNFVFKN